MTHPKSPEGNFKMNINFRRNGNNSRPAITGRISTPEDPQTHFDFSAFEKTDKNGETYWIGPVEMARSMRQALNTEPIRGAHFVAIRENQFKVFKEHLNGTPNPAYAALSAEEQAHADSLPAYWATWTRTANDPQLRASAWEREPNRYGPWASGQTQHPMTKEQAAAMRLETERMHAGDVLPEPAARGPIDDRAPVMDEAKAPSRRRASKSDDAGRA